MCKIKRITQFILCYNNYKSVTINPEKSKIFFMKLQMKTKKTQKIEGQLYSFESNLMTY